MLKPPVAQEVKTANRQIWFRAWYPKAKEWASGYSLSSYSENLDLRKIHTDGGMDDEEPVWSQFTGLRDKDGREIYEGDILRRGRQEVAQVIYSDEKMAFLLRGLEDWDVYFPSSQWGFLWEVIGNIYEGPELINAR